MVMIDSLPDIKVEAGMRDIIKSVAEKVLLMEEGEDQEISIFITDNSGIHSLNKLYRDVDRPTDVLAFAMREGEDGELNQEILGDVVISLQRAEEQAGLYGHSLEMEVSLLVAHGVLHLLGYEHEKMDDILVMKHKQREILRSLGYDMTGFVDRMKESADGQKGG